MQTDADMVTLTLQADIAIKSLKDLLARVEALEEQNAALRSMLASKEELTDAQARRINSLRSQLHGRA